LHIETVTVLARQVLGGNYRVLKFASGKIAAGVKPGQFIHLRVDDGNDYVLRRPFSVFKADRRSLTILFKIVGKGTEILARLRAGKRASIIGPLGNGFPMPAAGTFPLLIAGGYGSAALYLLAERSRKKGIIFIGGGTAGDILCLDDFKRLGWNVRVATEDGSAGQKGLVTDILTEYLSEKGRSRRSALYACGPEGMLKAVTGIARAGGLKAWLSLDNHMGCGVGACLACVQKVKTPGKHRSGESWEWARVCTEGPVFECREIVWGNAE
jgi:dihydroorotate dehydrogenase electron transfer subunit